MIISCEKAINICNKSQYKEAPLWDRILLGMHKLICKMCKSHTSKNTKFTSLCNKANLNALTEEEKNKIKNKLSVIDQK